MSDEKNQEETNKNSGMLDSMISLLKSLLSILDIIGRGK